MQVTKFTTADAPFERSPGQEAEFFVGNVVDGEDGGPISIGFGRCAPNQSIDDTIVVDDVMIVTKGQVSVRSADGEVTAGPGEVIYLPPGATVTIFTREEGVEWAYVTYPHWKTASA